MTEKRRGMMFVLSSPSGAGKTTLSRRLLERQSPSVVMSVSVTTRPKRENEVEGRDYFFVTQAQYDRMSVNNELLEGAKVFNNWYGTPRSFVEKHLAAGTDVLFDIDWQGTRKLSFKHHRDLVSVFILPPTMAELERRLKQRAQDSMDVVLSRMAKARDEISHWQEYEYVLVNDDLEATLAKVENILLAERRKRARQLWLEEFMKRL